MKTGVLLMAHGTPSSLDDMPEYLRLVRGGRPPTDELVAEMRHHYEAIGGRSPLTDITLAQASALQERLGSSMPVAVGMRNWKPFIGEALEQLARARVEHVVAIPLAPQFSSLSVQKYIDAATAALPSGVALDPIRSFHVHPILIDAFAQRLKETQRRDGESVVFTAHSLPLRVIQAGDGYADEVAATARAVAEKGGIRDYSLAYQSAGRTPEPWIGPDLNELIVQEWEQKGASGFLVVPVGFVCDHTEILFDIDIMAADSARNVGATLRRTESLNASPRFVDLLEDLGTLEAVELSSPAGQGGGADGPGGARS